MRYGGVSWWMPEVFLLQVMAVLWRALVTLFWYGYNIGVARTYSTCLRHHESVNMAALKQVQTSAINMRAIHKRAPSWTFY